MNRLPDERFSGLQMEMLRDCVHDLQQNNSHLCRAPKKQTLSRRFYREK